MARGRQRFYAALRNDIVAHAEREFALASREKDGSTYRDILEGQLARQQPPRGNPERRAELEAELAVPPLPQAVGYLWKAYLRMRRRNAGSGFGPTPLEWADINAFIGLSGIRLAPWEVEIIEALDDVWLTEQAKKRD